MDYKEINVSTIQVITLYIINNNSENTCKKLEVEGCTFELRFVIVSRYTSGVKWYGTLYSRHSGSKFTSWWEQSKIITHLFKKRVHILFNRTILLHFLILY